MNPEPPMESSDTLPHPPSLEAVQQLTCEVARLEQEASALREERDQAIAARKAGLTQLRALERDRDVTANEFRLIGQLCVEHGVVSSLPMTAPGCLFAQLRDTFAMYARGSEQLRKTLSARREDSLEQAAARVRDELKASSNLKMERDTLATEVEGLKADLVRVREVLNKERVEAQELQMHPRIDLDEWDELSEDQRVEIVSYLKKALNSRIDSRNAELAKSPAPEMVQRVLRQRNEADSIAWDVIRSLVLDPDEPTIEDEGTGK